MPGVPSSRACDACRKQKKKCDEAQPQCSRCKRLGISCVGAGQRRFKFQVAGPKTSASSSSAASRRKERDGSVEELPPRPNASFRVAMNPRSEVDVLMGMLVKSVVPSTEVKYNIAWTYGDYFHLIPQRLGRNRALDKAVETLLTVHRDISVGCDEIPSKTLMVHNKALQELRHALTDSTERTSVETLCACMVLLIVHGLLDTSHEDLWSAHYEGAAEIYKARNYRLDPDDVFEGMLLQNLRGLMLIEGILIDRVRLPSDEWHRLMLPAPGNDLIHERLLEYVSAIPGLFRRRRASPDEDPEDLIEDAQVCYSLMKSVLDAYRQLEHSMSFIDLHEEQIAVHIVAYVTIQRMYGLALFFATVMNLLLRNLKPHDIGLVLDSDMFVAEIVQIADKTLALRPFGSQYVILCLAIAFSATSSMTIKEQLLETGRAFGDMFPSMRRRIEMENANCLALMLRLPPRDTTPGKTGMIELEELSSEGTRDPTPV